MLGRDDFNFFVENLFGHETRSISYREKHFGLHGRSWGGSLYPPRTPTFWQNFFSGGGKMGFLYFLFLDSARWFHMCLNPHQLPKETMCIHWNYFDVHPHICTSVTLVTENPTCSSFLIQLSRSIKPTNQRAAVLSLVRVQCTKWTLQLKKEV